MSNYLKIKVEFEIDGKKRVNKITLHEMDGNLTISIENGKGMDGFEKWAKIRLNQEQQRSIVKFVQRNIK